MRPTAKPMPARSKESKDAFSAVQPAALPEGPSSGRSLVATRTRAGVERNWGLSQGGARRARAKDRAYEEAFARCMSEIQSDREQAEGKSDD